MSGQLQVYRRAYTMAGVGVSTFVLALQPASLGFGRVLSVPLWRKPVVHLMAEETRGTPQTGTCEQPMKSEPPTPTRALDNKFRKM